MPPPNPEDKVKKWRNGTITICYRANRKDNQSTFSSIDVCFELYGTDKQLRDGFTCRFDDYVDPQVYNGISIKKIRDSEEYIIAVYGKMEFGFEELHGCAVAAVDPLSGSITRPKYRAEPEGIVYTSNGKNNKASGDVDNEKDTKEHRNGDDPEEDWFNKYVDSGQCEDGANPSETGDDEDTKKHGNSDDPEEDCLDGYIDWSQCEDAPFESRCDIRITRSRRRRTC